MLGNSTNHIRITIRPSSHLNMVNLFLCFQLLFVLHCVLCAPQAGEVTNDYNMDNSEPGVATDNCLCVPFYQCVDGKIIDESSGIYLRRKRQDEELALEEKYVPPECKPYHVCCHKPIESTVRPYVHRCGIRNPSGIVKRSLTILVTGETEFGEWPWQAAILLTDGSEFNFKCGGTLIDERHVLTIAHCVDKLQNDLPNIVIRLGEWDTQNTDEFLPHEDFSVEEIMIHPEYSPNNLFNDIAVLRLARDVVFKPHIGTACLPRDEDDFTGENCIVTGWGTNAYKDGKYSMIMKEVSVPVVSHYACQSMLRKTRLGRYFKLYKGFLCAGKEGEDSCKGDGGGPLVCYRSDNSYTAAGLVSWGIDCGQPGIPGVYVNVRKYINWISSKTRKSIKEYWSTDEY